MAKNGRLSRRYKKDEVLDWATKRWGNLERVHRKSDEAPNRFQTQQGQTIRILRAQIRDMAGKQAYLQRQVDVINAPPMKNVPPSEEWVVARARAVEVLSGVYFLVNTKIRKVVYIGKSTNIMGRIGQHIIEKAGEFDAYYYVTTEPDKISGLELYLIKKFKPLLNGEYKNSTFVSPPEFRPEIVYPWD